ncbi:MAG: ABC transporter permease subunit [Asgard group archaeon]|nr:ABC transporter permease subunit [Asgard group archaeon]
MSVFDKSYRRYTGALKGRFYRIWSIATNSFRVQLIERKVRMIILMILCNLPVISFTLMIIFTAIFVPGSITQILFGNFGTIDDAMYTVITFSYGDFPAPLIFLPIVFICAMNAGTIANDKKNNSLALYMARPISRLDYVLGKAISVYMVSSFVSIVPWFVFMGSFTLLAGVSGAQFVSSLWVYLSTIALGLLVVLFMGSLVLMFSSMSKQSVLAGILGVLIMFLPSFISTLLVQELDAIKWLSYLSISQLIRASAYLIFGKPSILQLDLFTPEINGGVSIVIMLAISVVAILLTINNSYREEID